MQYLIHHMLSQSAAKHPHSEAIVAKNNRLSYQDMAVQVANVAGSLRGLGINRGDRIAIFLPPDVTLPLAIFATAQASAVFVPIHHGMFPDQVSHILNDCGAVALITDAVRFERIQNILPDISTLKFTIVDSQDNAPDSLETYSWKSLCNHQPSPIDQCIEKDLAAILYTSGSTGRPKGVMLSHANVLAGAEIVSDYLHLSSADRLLAALPLSFDAGLNQLTTAVLQGATTVMLSFHFGREIVTQLVEEKITGLAGVPSLWSLLAQPSTGLAKQSLPHLRYITNTGGAMPQTVLRQLQEQLPSTDIVLMYGLTEAFRSTYLPADELEARPTSMGKPIPNTEILVINESGKRCAPGEIGELVHHGPTVSLGYWGHPDLTANVLRPHPDPPPSHPNHILVCYSGDLVRQDEEGFLYFIGRRDNQIKSAGFRISPTEVEDVLCEVASLRQAAVVGVPDPILGQHLIAFAIPEENAGDLNAIEVLADCTAKMPRHMVPKQIHFVDELPMTSSGKVNYPALREQLSSNEPHSPTPRRQAP